jgi:cysteinyl-tRNA synthetase
MREVFLYNSLTNEIDLLKPIEPGKVSMYVCGPTVYNSPHIGNVRPVIVFDVLRRFLQYIGYDVTYVSNYTDVDDKIINRAALLHVSEKELSEKYILEYEEVLKELNVEKATLNPRVTLYMPKIIKYIGELIDKKAAYVVDGDVYFRVSSIKNYGELSNINVDDLLVGARIEENTNKESPIDFALWKKTTEGISWDSPWSKGRPGWHTECCVMINSIFPKHLIDIHGGGFDLKFPHHENEMAQAKAHDNNKLANIWMHNGFLNINDEKMSKSLGNVLLAKDVIKSYGGEVVRLLMLSAQYRAPLNFTNESVINCNNELSKIKMCYKQLAVKLQLNSIDFMSIKDNNMETFLKALADDLNIANAMSELFSLIKKANLELRGHFDSHELVVDFNSMHDMMNIIGLSTEYPTLSADDKMLYQQYLDLKSEKRFAESDIIRQQLIAKGIL